MLHLRIIIHYCQIMFLLMGQTFEWGVCTSQRMVTSSALGCMNVHWYWLPPIVSLCRPISKA